MSFSSGSVGMSAYTKGLLSQIDRQVDSWRTRADGIGGGGAPTTEAADPASVRGAPNNQFGTSSADAPAVDEQIGRFRSALAVERSARLETETALRGLREELSSTRRFLAELTEDVSTFRNEMGMVRTALRASQEEATALRHRVQSLERQVEHGIGAPPSTSTVPHAGGSVSTADMMALLSNALQNRPQDGAGHHSQTTLSVADREAFTRSMRGEIASMRDDLRAEINFGLRQLSAVSSFAPGDSLIPPHSPVMNAEKKRAQPVPSASQPTQDAVGHVQRLPPVSAGVTPEPPSSGWTTRAGDISGAVWTSSGSPVVPSIAHPRGGAEGSTVEDSIRRRFSNGSPLDDPPTDPGTSTVSATTPSAASGVAQGVNPAQLAAIAKAEADRALTEGRQRREIEFDEEDARIERSAQERSMYEDLRRDERAERISAMNRARDKSSMEVVTEARAIAAQRRASNASSDGSHTAKVPGVAGERTQAVPFTSDEWAVDAAPIQYTEPSTDAMMGASSPTSCRHQSTPRSDGHVDNDTDDHHSESNTSSVALPGSSPVVTPQGQAQPAASAAPATSMMMRPPDQDEDSTTTSSSSPSASETHQRRPTQSGIVESSPPSPQESPPRPQPHQEDVLTDSSDDAGVSFHVNKQATRGRGSGALALSSQLSTGARGRSLRAAFSTGESLPGAKQGDVESSPGSLLGLGGTFGAASSARGGVGTRRGVGRGATRATVTSLLPDEDSDEDTW